MVTRNKQIAILCVIVLEDKDTFKSLPIKIAIVMKPTRNHGRHSTAYPRNSTRDVVKKKYREPSLFVLAVEHILPFKILNIHVITLTNRQLYLLHTKQNSDIENYTNYCHIDTEI